MRLSDENDLTNIHKIVNKIKKQDRFLNYQIVCI